MTIAKTLRDIADDLAHYVDAMRRGEEPKIDIVQLAERRIKMQAEMLEEGLHE